MNRKSRSETTKRGVPMPTEEKLFEIINKPVESPIQRETPGTDMCPWTRDT